MPALGISRPVSLPASAKIVPLPRISRAIPITAMTQKKPSPMNQPSMSAFGAEDLRANNSARPRIAQFVTMSATKSPMR